MAEEDAPVRVVHMSMTIDRPVPQVHSFLANVANWPKWAVINVLSVGPADSEGWSEIETAQGRGEIRIYADATTGLVDHDFRDGDDIFRVPARVVANGRGAEFTMTLLQPDGLADEDFDRELTLLETELATLKVLLERS